MEEADISSDEDDDKFEYKPEFIAEDEVCENCSA